MGLRRGNNGYHHSTWLLMRRLVHSGDEQEYLSLTLVGAPGERPRKLGRLLSIHQGPDQPQQFLMLGAMPAPGTEVAYGDIAASPTGRQVGLVPDEHAFRTGVTDERPAVAIRAAVKLPGLEGMNAPQRPRSDLAVGLCCHQAALASSR